MSVNSKPKARREVSPRSSEGRLRTVHVKRSDAVLEVAGDLFLSHGYAGVSIEMIVAKTGGSYRDLYKEFGGKESLFLRVMSDVCNQVLAPLRAAALPKDGQHIPIEKALLAIGKTVLSTLLSSRVLELHRLIVSEAPRFPDLGKTFFQMGPSSANDAVAAFLTARSVSDGLLINDPSVAAAIFLDMLTNNLQLRALTGGVVLQSEIDERVREATRIFLNGLRITDAT